MPNGLKTNQPKMPADIGFGLGFFCGAVVAGFGVFLCTTPEGNKLKHEIESEFIKHKQAHLAELETELEQVAGPGYFTSALKQLKALFQPPAADKPHLNSKNTSESHQPSQKKKKYFSKKDR